MKQRTSHWIPWAIACVVIAGTAYWARSVPWLEQVDALRDASPLWLVLASLAHVATIILRGAAWAPFLDAVGAPSTALAVRGSFAMNALNCVLIGNAGEAARVFAVTREAGVTAVSVGATIALERTVITAVHVLMAVAVGFAIPLPPQVAGVRTVVFAMFSAAGLAALYAARVANRGTGRSSRLGRLRALVHDFVRAFRVAASWRRVSVATLFAAAMWCAGVATIHWTARALAFDTTVAESAAAFLMLSMGAMLRATPANVGVTQVVYATTVALFGRSAEDAVAVSLAIQVVQTVPTIACGVPFVASLWMRRASRGQRRRATGEAPA